MLEITAIILMISDAEGISGGCGDLRDGPLYP